MGEQCNQFARTAMNSASPLLQSCFFLGNCVLLLFLALCVGAGTANGKNIVLPRTGAYTAIDTDSIISAIATLRKGEESERTILVKDIKKNPQNYAPPVLYQLSETLLMQGNKDEAAFWFYAGQLRARYDALRCVDKTAAQAARVKWSRPARM